MLIVVVVAAGAVGLVGMSPSSTGSFLAWHWILKYELVGNIHIDSHKKQSVQSVSERLFMQIRYIYKVLQVKVWSNNIKTLNFVIWHTSDENVTCSDHNKF